MKKLSRILAVVSAAAMMLSLAACGSNGGSAANSGSTQSSASQTGDGQKYTIGICQLVQHPALDKATQGFKDALTEKLGEGNVTFNEQNANGDSPTCSTIINGFVSSNVDLILANATAPLQAAAAGTDSIPVIGTSVTDYATALDIDQWTGSTGRNISGTCDLAPLDQQAAMIQELFPDAKTVGMLYCSGEPNSVYQIEQMEGYLTEMGYTCERFSFTDSNDVASVTQTACASSNVIYVPIDYYDIGYQAGEMAYDVLVNGADISTMDVQSAATAVKMYNESVCQQLGLTMPEDYSPIAAD